MRYMLKSKIHRARVTDANINYEGSITVDAELMDLADVLPYEKVHVVDVDNGARLETYAIPGPRGSGVMCVNGAAARLVHRGDTIIILSYHEQEEAEARKAQPRLVYVNERNEVIDTKNTSLYPSPSSGEGYGVGA